MSEPDFRLDPSRFPRSLELSLDPEVLEQLQEQARATGRSVDEIILEILDQSMQQTHPQIDENSRSDGNAGSEDIPGSDGKG
jgi:hypothetical protein